MSAEQNETPVVETQTPPAQVEAQADPYAGLSADEREDAEFFDNALKTATPAERVRILRLAREGNKAVAERDKPKPSAEIEKPKAEPDKLTAAEQRIAALEKRLENEDATKKQDRAVHDFNNELDRQLKAAIDEIADDADVQEDIREQAIGAYARNPPTSAKGLEALVSRIIERRAKHIEKTAGDEETRAERRRKYAASKAEDVKATRGTSGKGGSPGKEEKKYTVGDFNSGRMAADVTKQLNGE